MIFSRLCNADSYSYPNIATRLNAIYEGDKTRHQDRRGRAMVVARSVKGNRHTTTPVRNVTVSANSEASSFERLFSGSYTQRGPPIWDGHQFPFNMEMCCKSRAKVYSEAIQTIRDVPACYGSSTDKVSFPAGSYWRYFLILFWKVPQYVPEGNRILWTQVHSGAGNVWRFSR